MQQSSTVRWALVLVVGFAFWQAKQATHKRLSEFERATPVVSLDTARFHGRSLKKFSLGFDNLIANLTWVALLQKASHEPLEHPGVSWEYAKVRSIVSLDRHFRKAYWFGAAFVSIFRRDTQGARDLLEAWVRYEPLNWQSHYMLGFHLFHEMGEYEAASVPMLRAASLPNAPSWLASLGIRLLSEAGALSASLQTAVQLYESVKDPEGRYRLRARVRSLNYGLQKARLTSALVQYRNEHGTLPSNFADLQNQARQPAAMLPELNLGDVHPDLQPLLSEAFDFRYDPDAQVVVGVLPESDKHLETTGVHRTRASSGESGS